MVKTYINQWGISVPKLGFGSMRLPQVDGKIDEVAAQEMVDIAMKNGLNYFDTAYMYHDGASETFLGKALAKYPRESYTITDKLPIWMCKTREDMFRILDEQLNKCNVSYFDFYFLHSLDSEKVSICKKLDAFSFLQEAQAQGKIRRIGFSFHGDFETMEWLLNRFTWDLVQIQLNYIDWEVQKASRIYELLCSRNIPIMVMEPVRGGYLANFNDEVNQVFKSYAPHRSIASWALQWVASLPGVAVVLSGMSNRRQLEDNLQTFHDFKPQTTEEKAVVEKALETLAKYKTVPCTGCRYCMDCPQGVDIPGCFSVYNDYKLTNNKWSASSVYFDLMKEPQRANHCISCGLCKTLCPQHIDIPTELKAVHSTLKELENV